MKALLIEDSAILRATIIDALRDEGYVVDAEADGNAGLAKLSLGEYDIVILDVLLPDVDGFKVLAKIRSMGDTPVIMLTARDAIADRVKGLDLGADDYLTKPFDLLELLARMRSVRRRQTGERTPLVEFGDVAIDRSGKTVFKGGSEVELTSREYAIIETLVGSSGRVVSKDYLYEHLYSDEDSTVSNVLEVYVSRLRSKLGKNFIKTRRGFGYYIERAV